MLRTLYLLILIVSPVAAFAGSPDSLSLRSLDTQRIYTNMTGMSILGGWGLLNMSAGIAGAVTARPGELKHFHQMNAIWGAVNLGIAGLGFLGARRELTAPHDPARSVQRYAANKKLYLINASLDAAYIAAGAYLVNRASRSDGNADLYRGFGKSLILQGAALLAFDAAMYSAHRSRSASWNRLMQGLTVSGDGIGWRYVLQ